MCLRAWRWMRTPSTDCLTHTTSFLTAGFAVTSTNGRDGGRRSSASSTGACQTRRRPTRVLQSGQDIDTRHEPAASHGERLRHPRPWWGNRSLYQLPAALSDVCRAGAIVRFGGPVPVCESHPRCRKASSRSRRDRRQRQLPAKKLPASNAEDWPCRFTSGQPFLEFDGGIPPSEAKARTLSPGPPSVAAISNYLSARGKAYPVPTTYLDR